jgi:hypothetical protein
MAGASFVVFILVEVAFRLFVPVTDVPLHFWDPVLGPRKLPNQSGRWLVGSYVAGSYNFNAQGWNHKDDYGLAKPSGTRRVCVVGDSYVEALQVDVEETLFAVAERRMSRADNPVQWYAFGISGWGTANGFEVIRHYVLDHQPDVVILLFVQNDPFDSSPYLLPMAPHEVRYWLDVNGELKRQPLLPWKPVWWRRLGSRSALVRYFSLQQRLLKRFGPRRHNTPGWLAYREQMANAGNDFVEGLEDLSVAQRQEKTWRLIEKLLEAIRDECRHRGAIFTVAFRGWAADIEAPIGGSPRWPSTTLPPQGEDPYCLESRMRVMGPEQVAPMCERLGIPYLDLTEALRAEVARTGRSHFFPDNNHYGPLGHQAAGNALADWVSQL